MPPCMHQFIQALETLDSRSSRFFVSNSQTFYSGSQNQPSLFDRLKASQSALHPTTQGTHVQLPRVFTPRSNITGDHVSQPQLYSNRDSVESTNSFSFFGTSREIRNMIYGQPEMLEVVFLETSVGLPHPSQIVGTKPRVNLRLICRRFDQNNMERCVERKRLFVMTTIYTCSDCPKT
jgi:hypothetical protein